MCIRDSLYLVHGRADGRQRVLQTRDHSVVQRLVDDGMISREQAAIHPMRNRVFSCLGGSVNPQNCCALARQPHIDGLFIGRAAWNAAGFIGIVEAVISDLGEPS